MATSNTDNYAVNTAVRLHIQQHIQTMWAAYFGCVQSMVEAVDIIYRAFQEGGKLMICGNGGSAADAQHLAAEFVPKGLPAIALTTDSSFLTAYANDVGYYRVFAQQVESLGYAGDVLLVLTTSGKSRNIIEAVQSAHRGGIKVIAMTGDARMGKFLEDFCDTIIAVPSSNTQHIQEAHVMLYHALWLQVLEKLQEISE